MGGGPTSGSLKAFQSASATKVCVGKCQAALSLGRGAWQLSLSLTYVFNICSDWGIEALSRKALVCQQKQVNVRTFLIINLRWWSGQKTTCSFELRWHQRSRSISARLQAHSHCFIRHCSRTQKLQLDQSWFHWTPHFAIKGDVALRDRNKWSPTFRTGSKKMVHTDEIRDRRWCDPLTLCRAPPKAKTAESCYSVSSTMKIMERQ